MIKASVDLTGLYFLNDGHHEVLHWPGIQPRHTRSLEKDICYHSGMVAWIAHDYFLTRSQHVQPPFLCRPNNPRRWLHNQSGFSLLEVLIALLVLAVGLLGLAALQNMGLRLNHQSYERTQATILIYDMIDRMRANPAGVVAGDYLQAMTGTPPTASQNCESSACVTSAAMAAYDKNRWIATIAGSGTQRAALAGGQGSISAAGISLFNITVQWQEQNTSAVLQQTVKVQLP